MSGAMSSRGAFQSPLGGIRFGPGLPLGPMVKYLLIANTAIYFLGLINPSALREFALVPYQLFGEGKIWQLVTYMFLHDPSNMGHLFFNMLMLWMFGTAIEHAWGSRGFLFYYVLCGVGGGLAQWAVSIHSPGSVVGASGAIAGLIVAYALMYPERQLLLFLVIPVKVKYFVWLPVVLAVFSWLGAGGDNVAHFAHLGGMGFGWLYLKQDWRLSAGQRKLRGIWAREKMRKNTQRETRQQEAQQQERATVDEILDKISTQGIDSLTETERKILREASRS